MALTELTSAEMQHMEHLAKEGLELAGDLDLNLPSFGEVKRRGRTRFWKGTALATLVLLLAASSFTLFSNAGETAFAMRAKNWHMGNELKLETSTKLESVKARPMVEENIPTDSFLESAPGSLEQELVLPLLSKPIAWQQEQAERDIRLASAHLRHYDVVWMEHCMVYVQHSPATERYLPSNVAVWKENELDRDSLEVIGIAQDLPTRELSSALARVYAGDMQKAKSEFSALYANYTRDVNVLFYLGFAHYQLGEYESALSMWKNLRALSSEVFQEEVVFYEALSCEHLGFKEEATTKLKMLACGRGHYANRAKCVLAKGSLPCGE